jgi:GTP-binding protein
MPEWLALYTLIFHNPRKINMSDSTTKKYPPIIHFKKAEFLISSPNLKLCPPETGAEVAFAGRSNAGKSSAINKLTDNHKLARTSKTPGRTQLLNFFQLSTPEQRLVDLPGYGYAKVPVAMKLKWQENLSEYLQKRKSLKGLIILMDIRHPLQSYDTMMLNWGVGAAMPVHILLTKSDKLNRGPAQSTLLTVKKYIKGAKMDNLVSAQTFSSSNGDGLKELERVLQAWLELPEAFEQEQSNDQDLDPDSPHLDNSQAE